MASTVASAVSAALFRLACLPVRLLAFAYSIVISVPLYLFSVFVISVSLSPFGFFLFFFHTFLCFLALVCFLCVSCCFIIFFLFGFVLVLVFFRWVLLFFVFWEEDPPVRGVAPVSFYVFICTFWSKFTVALTLLRQGIVRNSSDKIVDTYTRNYLACRKTN